MPLIKAKKARLRAVYESWYDTSAYHIEYGVRVIVYILIYIYLLIFITILLSNCSVAPKDFNV